MGDDAGLAAARAGQDEHRALGGEDRLALLRVQPREAAGTRRRAWVRRLLDRDGLGEVARLVHVAPGAHRHVVGQELQGQDDEEGRPAPRRSAGTSRMTSCGARGPCAPAVSPWTAMAMHPPAARLHLLHVGEHLLVRPALRAQRATTGRLSSMRAMGPCFISPAGIALGVDVGDLLQLEGALERDRVVDAAAQVQEVACAWPATCASSSMRAAGRRARAPSGGAPGPGCSSSSRHALARTACRAGGRGGGRAGRARRAGR